VWNTYFCATPTRSADFIGQIKHGAVRVRPDARERFLSNVAKSSDGCWRWRHGDVVRLGNAQNIAPPVLAFVLFCGALNDHKVRHVCGNSACVNPQHMHRSASKFGAIGRPRIGVERLNITVNDLIRDELLHCEHEQGAHRNDVARQVLCEWATQQRQLRKSHD
jgi:hypothetical protein